MQGEHSSQSTFFGTIYGDLVRAGQEAAVEEIFAGYGLWGILIGEATNAPQFTVTIGEQPFINLPLSATPGLPAWQRGRGHKISAVGGAPLPRPESPLR